MIMTEKIAALDKVNGALDRRGSIVRATYEPIWKNNGRREGIALRASDSICGVVVYPKEDMWCKNPEDIATELENTYLSESITLDQKTIEDVLEKSYILSHVKPRVVSSLNYQGLADRDCAIKEYIADLIEVFSITIDEMPEGSIKITNAMLKNAGIEIEELHRHALQNQLPDASFKSLGSELAILTGMDEDEIGDDYASQMLWILTNKDKVYGAAMILDNGILSGIRSRMGGDYYVLPSSIHEVLILKADGSVTEEGLLDMVTCINSTEVQPEDRLTDNVYLYTKDGLKSLF